MDSDDRKITQLPVVTSLSDSDLLVTVVNIGTAPQTKAISKSNAIRGGLTVTAESVTTSNVTGVEGTLHNLDVSGMTANRDFNLPTPSAAGVRCGVRLSTGDATYALLVKINSVEWSRIFITNEILIFVATGTGAADWAIELDGRIPCKAEIKNTGSQTIATATVTTVVLDELVSDNASIADTTNYRFNLRRASSYIILASVRLSITADAVSILGYYWDGTNTLAITDKFGKNGAAPDAAVNAAVALAAGSYVEYRIYQTSGANAPTLVTGGNKAYMQIIEVLP